ncbi:MAG: polysaccharide pyruvyl transferase CsaB [Clostridiaceae bacterium]|nr:polysaccharide pyruvyl transferase CsaB [Clostridiaceae bacterium]
MKVLHLIGGGDVGGAKSHVLSLVRQLSNHITVKLISLRPGPFADDAKAMGIDTIVVRSGNILRDIKTVIRLIQSEGYDILHTHGAKANMIGVFAKRHTGIPVVSTVHSDYRLDYLHSILKMYTFGLINTVALRLIDYYIGVSNNYKEMLIRRGFPAHRIYTVYNGIPFDNSIDIMPKADFARKYGIELNDDDVVVGILARLHPVKGHTVFLDAAEKVLKKFPRTKFLIGGPGDELRPALEKKARQLGISENVFFLGAVAENYSFLAHIDINVLTSYSESFPYAILEGARMKKATVSSKVGGLEDLFVQGENGFLYTPGDSDALAEHLITLIGDPDKRKVMGEKLYEAARYNFSLKAMTETQLSIYKSILKNQAKIKKDGKEYDIAILGYYGYRNSGDDAILKSFIDHLKQNHKNVSVIVLSNNPSETRRLYNVQAVYRFHPLRIPSVLSKTRLFVAGGGTLLQDDTSSRSLWYYLFMLHLAMKKGTRLALLANGLGPLTMKKNRKAAASILDRMDVITLRDPYAFEELKSLGVSKPVTMIAADPAMALTPCDHSPGLKILSAEGVPTDKNLIAFCLRKWKKVRRSEKILAALADKVADEFNSIPLFVPMHYPDDFRFLKKVMYHMKRKGYILQKHYSVDETLSILGNVKMVVGMRLHSLIYAAKLSIPMVGLAYEPKVNYFMQSINQPYVHWNRNFSMKDLMEKISYVWSNASRIRSELDEIKPVLEEKVKEAIELTLSLLSDE